MQQINKIEYIPGSDDDESPAYRHATLMREINPIIFPQSLLGDLMTVAARATNTDPARFSFVFRGHLTGRQLADSELPDDSTPCDLIAALDSGEFADENDDIVSIAELAASFAWGESDDNAAREACDMFAAFNERRANKEKELENYFFNYDLVTRVTTDALAHARAFSGYTNDDMSLALDGNRPTDKKARRKQRRLIEGLALHAELVGGKFGSKRCSNGARRARASQLAAQEEWLASNRVYCAATGESFALDTVASKRKKRLSELYAIAKGIEIQIAKTGLGWLSCVATAPAEMHANPTKGKRRWNGTMPHEVATWFAERWALVRARLAKFGITPSGVWTREAHGDACPHVNFLIAYPADQYKEVARALTEVFAHGPNAIKIRRGGRVKPGQKSASFASYAMKYFLKGMQGWGTDDDSDSEESTASAFGYRRFGFFGIPSRSNWRELRRMKDRPTISPTITAAWRAARRGDASTFIALAGGLACKRSARPIQTLRETPDNCTSPQVVGVREVRRIKGERETVAIIRTRTPGQYTIVQSWKVTVKPNCPRGDASATQKADFGGGGHPPPRF